MIRQEKWEMAIRIITSNLKQRKFQQRIEMIFDIISKTMKVSIIYILSNVAIDQSFQSALELNF